MAKLEKVLYTAKIHTTGGRDGGESRSEDGRLQIKLSPPGMNGMGTNPEQLFAAGWSACFLSALKLVAAKMKIPLPGDLAVDTEVDLGLAQGVHHLAARITVRLPGVTRETAEELVEGAQHACPYSNATHGNIEVSTQIVTDQARPVTQEAAQL